jgi:hypothetical protein
MLSGIKPLSITKKQAKEILPPRLVDRLIYAARNFPELGWLEILPPEPGKKVRETDIVYESLENAFDRIRKTGEYPPEMPLMPGIARSVAKRGNWPLDAFQSGVISQNWFQLSIALNQSV